MLDPEIEALRQGIGDPLAMADMGICLEAEQGAALLSGDFRSA
jgi:hypothetical protein